VLPRGARPLIIRHPHCPHTERRQAVYCLSKAIAHDSKDADARWDRAVLYAELGEQAKAIHQFQIVSMRWGGPLMRMAPPHQGAGLCRWQALPFVWNTSCSAASSAGYGVARMTACWSLLELPKSFSM